jgi:2-polyprenyl-3-methyl-5-hydroxy-6-metoxy-1,4-benzoquinol methylase
MTKTHRDMLIPELNNILESFGNIVGKTVLEIGHGQDKQIRAVLESKGLVYHGLENYIGINNEWKEKGEENPTGPEYYFGTMEECDKLGLTFDFIVLIHAFEHCERPVDALKSMRKLLKDNGAVIIVTPNPCKHHIIDADPDHIMVLNDMQLMRLLIYTKYSKIQSYTLKQWNELEQNWNVFTVGVK